MREAWFARLVSRLGRGGGPRTAVRAAGKEELTSPGAPIAGCCMWVPSGSGRGPVIALPPAASTAGCRCEGEASQTRTGADYFEP